MIIRLAQNQKTGMPNNLKVFWTKKTKRPKKGSSKNGLGSSIMMEP
jgi:hypothetical protein